MDFYTFVLKESVGNWVALCLENGLVGQGFTKDIAAKKLKEAIKSFEEVYSSEEDVYTAPVSVRELHEFLIVEGGIPFNEHFELRAVNA